MSNKKAFITGINGQDGAYLAKYLLDLNYQVHGLIRWDSDMAAGQRLTRFEALGIKTSDITIHSGDVTDPHQMLSLIYQTQPDEVYNLAAISHVGQSFKSPNAAIDTITKGTLNLLEALWRTAPQSRFYQASSSEIFGDSPAPQSELSPMNPQSPYAIAKLSAYHLTKLYRKSHKLFACNGILFNHESPLRGIDFVTKKITENIKNIRNGSIEYFTLGNLDAMRDWGHAQDYIAGMHKIITHTQADDFILATGTTTSVRDFTSRVFELAGLPISWQGKAEHETAIDAKGITRVKIDPALLRPTEVNLLQGDASKAKTKLGWQAQTSLDDLIKDMLT